VAGVFIVVALSEELEDRKAALPARNGSSAVAGLTVQAVSSGAEGDLCRGGDAPRRAIEAADLVVDSILPTNRKERVGAKEWRVKTRGGGGAGRDGSSWRQASHGFLASPLLVSRFPRHLIGWTATSPLHHRFWGLSVPYTRKLRGCDFTRVCITVSV
jgi:hypothetical protein